jgi:serine/threonine protein kinase
MTIHHPNLQTLHASLAGELSDDQESVAKAHLAQCESCRRRFEELAGSGEDWSRIADALRVEAQSQRSLRSSSSAQRDADSPIYPSEYAQSPIDFAISFLEPSHRTDSIGKIGEFEILSVIGFGGMGIVLKGFQEELNRPVAVKVMAPHLATSGAARQRFLREAQATAAIVHPNVMPILSVSEKASLPFLVMPYVACHSLQQRIDTDGALPVVEVLRIALQVAEGLAAAHAQGLVHRDVKPANILLERGIDRALLTDFGLARAADDATLTRSGVIAGTPQYMSPEQARGEALDRRSDLFSLGSVIYTMCVGHPPFRADTSYGILRKVTDSEVRSMREQNAQVPKWLERLCLKLMAKDAAQRYDNANEVAQLLRECLAQVQQPMAQSIPASLQGDAPKTQKRNLYALGILVASLLMILAGTSAWTGLLGVVRNEAPIIPAEPQSTDDRAILSAVTTNNLRSDETVYADLSDLSEEVNALLLRIATENSELNTE